MVFSSITFLFYFLPIILLIYFISPKRMRNGILALASLLFYAWGEPRYILIMLISTVMDYTCGRLIEREQSKGNRGYVFLIISLIFNLSILGYFKYYNFFAGNVLNLFGIHNAPIIDILLPIGISFYTFQTMSYTIDVYRGRVKAQHNIINFMTFVTLFPQLIAGPIVRYTDIEKELNNNNRTHVDFFAEGVARFIAGLGKKVLLANNIGLLWDTIHTYPIAQMSLIGAWLGIIAYAFQIYFDFSGYSDMAIGLGKMFGFIFPENFQYPYISQSITEFWRRWHITLSSWFKEYVYIPLGGNRKGLPLQLRNILIVWLLTGFWHGASWNFIIWGLYYGILLFLEKNFIRKVLDHTPRFFRHLYALFFILIGWAIFAFDDLGAGIQYIKMMFGMGVPLINRYTLFELLQNCLLLAILTIGATPFLKKIDNSKCLKKTKAILIPILAVFVLLFSTAYLVDSGYNPFLYFRF